MITASNNHNEDPRKWGYVGAWVAAIVLWIAILLSLSSCTTLRRATLYMDNHYGDAGKYCATRFPLDSAVREGVTVIKSDTEYLPGQQIPCPPDAAPISGYAGTGQSPVLPAPRGSVRCPPSRIITITKHTTDTVTRVDHAAIAALSAENTKLNDEAVQASDKANAFKSGRKWWQTAAIITWGILAAMGAGFVLSKTMKIPI